MPTQSESRPDVPTWLLAAHGLSMPPGCVQSAQVDKTTHPPPEHNTVNPGKLGVILGNDDLTDEEWARKFRTYEYTDKKTKIRHLVIERRDFSWTRTK